MSKQKPDDKLDIDELDALIEDIFVDAYGADEQLWAFLQTIEDEVILPADGFVMGEPVSVIAVDYDGDDRRGLTAACRRGDGPVYVLALADVAWSSLSAGINYIAAYRRWLNLEPYPVETGKIDRRPQQKMLLNEAIDLNEPLDLIVLAVTARAVRCRLPGSERIVTLNNSRHREVVPGAVITVAADKQWVFKGHRYLSGQIVSDRIDAIALGLVPLRLEDQGLWNPDDEYWGNEAEPIPEWSRPIKAYGPRRLFEMEQVLPGSDPADPFDDPITRSVESMRSGDASSAIEILMDLCRSDLRCLDAHAHLGNYSFDLRLTESIRHYEMGVRIGELSLGDDFNGVLLWGLIDNRPFLRCLHGYGLCLWQLGRFDDAAQTFQRLLWLNPSDNQGVRFLIDDVRAKKAWSASEE